MDSGMSDEDKNEVYFWKFNATSSSVAYTNVVGSPDKLSKPRRMKLDAFCNLYVADNDNSRIVMYCVNSTNIIIVSATNGKPVDLAF
jgi:hypothetical protein